MGRIKEPLIHITRREDMPVWKGLLIRVAAIVVALCISAAFISAASPRSRGFFDYFGSLFSGAFGTERRIWILLQNTALLLAVAVALVVAMVLSVDATLSVMKMASFKAGLRRFREMRRDFNGRVEALVASGKKELAEELRARFEADMDKARASFAGSMRHITLSNPTMTARSREITAQLELLRSWTHDRKELIKRQKAELKALDEENLDKLRRQRNDKV